MLSVAYTFFLGESGEDTKGDALHRVLFVELAIFRDSSQHPRKLLSALFVNARAPVER